MPENVLILDDEPHLLTWLEEYLASKGFLVHFSDNVGSAIRALNEYKFRLVVVDLNVPITEELREKVGSRGPLYEEYRGLFFAEYARTKGYRNRQVIVYSVHDLDAVREIVNKIRVTYVIKGRPRVFKEEIDSVLSYDPTQEKKSNY